MQVEEVTYGESHGGVPHYFSAILYEGWGFWTAGPSSYVKEHILLELVNHQNVERALLIKVYVPALN